MGKSSKTTTPINPQWATDANQGLANDLTAARKVDPLSRVAPTNSLLDQAAASAGAGISPELLGLINKGTGGASVSAQSGADFMDKYKNPYLDQVLKSALADFDVEAAKQNARADLGLAGSGAFGGSGAALTKSMLGGELARGRAATSAGISSDAFNTAANYGSQDANRFLQASTANAQFADSAAGRALQAAGLLGNLEQQRFSNQFAMGDYQRNLDSEVRNADLGALERMAAINSAIPYQLFSGSKTKTSGGLLGGLGSALLGGGMLAGNLGWKPFG